MISMNRPKMESRPYEFLLHSPVLMLLIHIMSIIHRDILHPGSPTANLGEYGNVYCLYSESND